MPVPSRRDADDADLEAVIPGEALAPLVEERREAARDVTEADQDQIEGHCKLLIANC